MGRQRSLLGLMLFLTALLAGCWDRMELEDQLYLIAIGVDRAEEGGVAVTALVGLAAEIAAGGSETSVQPDQVRLAARLITARGETITQALHVLNGGLSRRLDLRQLRGVIVGEALGREGLEPIVMELTRSPWARGNVMFSQARGSAFDVMRALNPVAEINPPKMVEGLLMQAKSLHLTPPLRMHHFIARYAAIGGDPFLSAMAVNPAVRQEPVEPPGGTEASALPGQLPRGSGNPVDFAGTAIYRGDKLVGFINVDHTQMLLALRGEMGKAYVTFEDPANPDAKVTMRFHIENLPRYTATLRNGRPHVKVRLLFEGEVLAAAGGQSYAEPAARVKLEQAAAKYILAQTDHLLAKLRGWEADPVGFGHLYRGRFPSWRAWQDFGWHRRLGELEVTVEAEMRIRRIGLVLGPDQVGEGR